MKEKIFNQLVIVIVGIVFVIATGVKIFSIYTFPKIHNWNYYQIQEIKKGLSSQKEGLSFVVFADNKNSITTFNKLLQRVNKEKIAFSIDIGDLVEDGQKEKFRFFIDQIKKAKHPFLTVIGNHELRERGRANYYDFFGKFYYSFAAGNSYFIVLDDANEENLGPWQMEWLKEELKKSQSYKYRFVFMHVPLYDPRDAGSKIKISHCLEDKNSAEKLNSLFDKYGVTMVFASHIHGYWHGKWGKTPYIITGGAGAELSGTDPNHYFYHYVLVSPLSTGVRYQVVKLKTPPFEIVDRWLHNAWIYLYAFVVVHHLDIVIIVSIFYLSFYFVFIKKEWLSVNLKKDKEERRKEKENRKG